jgi:hypothetical protein
MSPVLVTGSSDQVTNRLGRFCDMSFDIHFNRFANSYGTTNLEDKRSTAIPPHMNKRFGIPGDQIQQLVRPMGSCFITDRVTVGGQKFGYMYRKESDRPDDSGWRFFSGDEIEEYLDDISHTGVYAVNTAAIYDRNIIPYLETPPPALLRRSRAIISIRAALGQLMVRVSSCARL